MDPLCLNVITGILSLLLMSAFLLFVPDLQGKEGQKICLFLSVIRLLLFLYALSLFNLLRSLLLDG